MIFIGFFLFNLYPELVGTPCSIISALASSVVVGEAQPTFSSYITKTRMVLKLHLLQISLNVFAIFLLQGCIQTHAGCPFSRGKRGAESFASEAEIVALLKERFNASIYSKGLDFETRVRDNPTKKNLFGACPSEKCLPSAKFRTFSGYCNNLKSSLSFGGRASRLKRLLVKC